MGRGRGWNLKASSFWWPGAAAYLASQEALLRAGQRAEQQGAVGWQQINNGICSALSSPLLCWCGTVVSEPADGSQLGANCPVIVRFLFQPLQFPELTQPGRWGEGWDGTVQSVRAEIRNRSTSAVSGTALNCRGTAPHLKLKRWMTVFFEGLLLFFSIRLNLLSEFCMIYHSSETEPSQGHFKNWRLWIRSCQLWVAPDRRHNS